MDLKHSVILAATFMASKKRTVDKVQLRCMILGQFPTIKDENARIWEEKKVTQINVFFKNLGAQVGIDSMLVETT